VNWPLEQSWQPLTADSPAGDALPPGQLKQDDSPVLPWYLPAAQSVQLDTAPAETLPCAQLVQLDAEAAEYFPDAQSSDLSVRPVAEQYAPAVQAEHDPWPCWAWKDPIAQLWQVPPIVEYWPAAQSVQSLAEDFPVPVEALPAAQSSQLVEPVLAW
jgi:hypothetical protein